MTGITMPPNTKKFILPISPNYVQHWGLWEAIREILQNAFDEQTKNPDCKVTFDWNDESQSIVISDSTGVLEKSSLILGNSSKADDKKLRGKFGEGYKLALLVLLRNQKRVTIYTGDEEWTPMIVHDSEFQSDVLCIKVEKSEHLQNRRGTAFLISDIDFNEWESLNENVYGTNHDKDFILEDENQKGRIYVGGLYVTTIEEFRYGYHFAPSTIQLDRDRGMLNSYNLAWQTSQLWAQRPEDPTLVHLIMDRVQDVYYIDQTSYEQKLADSLAFEFRRSHGETAIPVMNQNQLEEVQAAGRKAVMVPESMRRILARAMEIKVPKTGTPAQRIRKLVNENYFSSDVKAELEDIASILEGKVAEGDK